MDDERGAAPAGGETRQDEALRGERAGVQASAAAEAAIERQLRRLSTACAVPAAAAVAVIGAIVWTAEAPSSEGWLGSPPGESFLMSVGALLLVILSSAARARVLRGAREERSDEAGDVAGAGAGPDGWAGWLRVYSRATGISFAMLGAAVALGGMAALRGRAPFYGLVICLASLLAMIVRWPRRSGLDVAMDGADGRG